MTVRNGIGIDKLPYNYDELNVADLNSTKEKVLLPNEGAKLESPDGQQHKVSQKETNANHESTVTAQVVEQWQRNSTIGISQDMSVYSVKNETQSVSSVPRPLQPSPPSKENSLLNDIQSMNMPSISIEIDKTDGIKRLTQETNSIKKESKRIGETEKVKLDINISTQRQLSEMLDDAKDFAKKEGYNADNIQVKTHLATKDGSYDIQSFKTSAGATCYKIECHYSIRIMVPGTGGNGLKFFEKEVTRDVFTNATNPRDALFLARGYIDTVANLALQKASIEKDAKGENVRLDFKSNFKSENKLSDETANAAMTNRSFTIQLDKDKKSGQTIKAKSVTIGSTTYQFAENNKQYIKDASGKLKRERGSLLQGQAYFSKSERIESKLKIEGSISSLKIEGSSSSPEGLNKKQVYQEKYGNLLNNNLEPEGIGTKIPADAPSDIKKYLKLKNKQQLKFNELSKNLEKTQKETNNLKDMSDSQYDSTSMTYRQYIEKSNEVMKKHGKNNPYITEHGAFQLEIKEKEKKLEALKQKIDDITTTLANEKAKLGLTSLTPAENESFDVQNQIQQAKIKEENLDLIDRSTNLEILQEKIKQGQSDAKINSGNLSSELKSNIDLRNEQEDIALMSKNNQEQLKNFQANLQSALKMQPTASELATNRRKAFANQEGQVKAPSPEEALQNLPEQQLSSTSWMVSDEPSGINSISSSPSSIPGKQPNIRKA